MNDRVRSMLESKHRVRILKMGVKAAEHTYTGQYCEYPTHPLKSLSRPSTLFNDDSTARFI